MSKYGDPTCPACGEEPEADGSFSCGCAEEHKHEWGPVEEARFTGNPHRKCLTCGEITMDLDDDEE